MRNLPCTWILLLLLGIDGRSAEVLYLVIKKKEKKNREIDGIESKKIFQSFANVFHRRGSRNLSGRAVRLTGMSYMVENNKFTFHPGEV